MNYTTLQYNGVEKSLADWGIDSWFRTVQNQADDSFTCRIPTPMDGSDIFPYASQVIVRMNRAAGTVNPVNPTLPQSGSTSFTGGEQWFIGYCIDNDRVGDPGAESFNYKFVGPYQFFFERLIFQKLNLTWNGVKQIADYQSDIVLGLSLTVLSGTGDTVTGTTATNLMSIAQQIKEIVAYVVADSAYQQANPASYPYASGIATWASSGAQLAFDANTADSNGNYFLLATPSANCKIPDYAAGATGGLTSANTTGTILRCPLDAVNAITCAEAMRRQLQWIGGIGSPVVWTDHSQTPPVIHVCTRDQLSSVSLPLAGLAFKNKIKKRTDLLPAAVHFKYKVAGNFLGQPYSVVINDVAAPAGGSVVEGIGQLGNLETLAGAALAGGVQSALMALAKTSTAVVQTFDFQGANVSGNTGAIVCTPVNLSAPGSDAGFWTSLFPEFAGYSSIGFATGITPAVTNLASGATVSASTYSYRVTDGQVAPWMKITSGGAPVAGATVKCKIAATFNYTESATGNKCDHKELIKEVTLTNLPSGTYSSETTTAVGEPLPYGLAGYIYGIESILQYEGSILLQESEITDQCPIGHSLNITGGLAEWATMGACVQSVRYSDNGQTEIVFGPARHLGPAQFVARFRTNVGPRWYYLIGGDPLNSSGGSGGETPLGSNIPASSTGDGARNATFNSFLTNTASGPLSGSFIAPGVHIDSGSAANPGGFPTAQQLIAVYSATKYALLSASSTHQKLLLSAAGGVSSPSAPSVSADTADLPATSDGIAKFRQITICQGGTNYTAYFLMTNPVAGA